MKPDRSTTGKSSHCLPNDKHLYFKRLHYGRQLFRKTIRSIPSPESRKAAWEKERKYGKKPSPMKRPKTLEKSKEGEETPPVNTNLENTI